MYRPAIYPERDPMVALVNQMQKRPLKYIEEQLAASQRQMAAQQRDIYHQVARQGSLGEVMPSGINCHDYSDKRPGVRLVHSKNLEEEISPGKFIFSTFAKN